jgi:hypothetical protein
MTETKLQVFYRTLIALALAVLAIPLILAFHLIDLFKDNIKQA